MDKPTHTPTPWNLQGIKTVQPGPSADFIVLAVNLHDELIETLHAVNYAINLGDSSQQTEALDSLKQQIRNVIAKAEGK